VIIVTDVAQACITLAESLYLGLDTETTGLGQDDRLFSLQIATEADEFYFNFQSYGGDEPVLDRQSTFKWLNEYIFSKAGRTYFMHNAKFDLRMLRKEGAIIKGKVHCTYAIERVLKNNYIGKEPYSLAGCAKRRGLEKDSRVEEYITKHKLYTKVTIPGKKKVVQLKHFDKVPFQLMTEYGAIDARLALKIGLDQIATLSRLEREKATEYPSFYPVYNNEVSLTKTLLSMEETGIKIDRQRTSLALAYEMDEIEKSKQIFTDLTGREYLDSGKLFKEVFDKLGCEYPLTEKGNPSFAAEVLEEMDNPAANIINKIRHHEKRAGTYYSSFLHFATINDTIHADARQAGTETGRMSYRDPNLQNVPKEDDEEDLKTEYHVRECFIPREGKILYALDYKQMEYRTMMDYAGEKKIIQRIMDGEDFHDAIANEVGIKRKEAKTLNFAISYGAGDAKIAKMLGIKQRDAYELRCTYFGRLPLLQRFFKEVSEKGKARGHIFNWFGRRCYLSDINFGYILPNHLVQGGCADVVKIAMNRIHEEGFSSKMLIQVHDELIFEADAMDSHEFEEIKKIMESVYMPKNGMKLEASISHSLTRWGARNMKEGLWQQ
jgi:DNA polymerase I-like protein with 3'-5' exonuclease and polymerase domains